MTHFLLVGMLLNLSLALVSIVQVAVVAGEGDGGHLEGVEQNVGEVVGLDGAIAIYCDQVTRSGGDINLEVVVELEPELLVCTVLILSSLVIGVHQTKQKFKLNLKIVFYVPFDFVVFTTLVPFTTSNGRATADGGGSIGEGSTGEILNVSWLIVFFGISLTA